MKLSTKPRHFAPATRVRDLSGKMHRRIDLTNSTRPGQLEQNFTDFKNRFETERPGR